MNTLLNFYKKHFDAIFLSFGLIVTISVLVANLLALPNNLVCSDEGWYLCLLRDTPQVGATRYHLLFHNVFKNNIYAIRLACWFSQFLGALVLSLGITVWIRRYYKKGNLFVLYLLVLCSLYFGQMGMMTSCPSFNYITMNKIFAEISIGFMLIGLDRRKMIFFLLSGFMIAFLFPVMITNVIIIPIMFFVILLLSDNKWRNVGGFVIGVILFFVYYFVFVESPQEIVQFISVESKKVIAKSSGDYSIQFYILWFFHVVCYYGKCLIVAALLLAIYCKMKTFAYFSCKRNRVLTMVVVSIAVLLYMWTYLEPKPIVPFPYKENGSIVWYSDLYWIFIFMLLLLAVKSNKSIEKDKLVICCFFLIVPFCLCLGSNVLFTDRQREYLLFVMPVMVFLTLNRNIIWKSLMMVVLIVGFLLFFVSVSGRNIAGDKYFGEHISVETVGIQQNVKLSQSQISGLVTCKNRVPKGKVLCGSYEWWMVALLDYIPISHTYKITRNEQEMSRVLNEEIEKNGNVWAISSIWENDFNEKMEMMHGYDMQIDTLGDHVFYYVSREKQLSEN